MNPESHIGARSLRSLARYSALILRDYCLVRRSFAFGSLGFIQPLPHKSLTRFIPKIMPNLEKNGKIEAGLYRNY